MQNGHGYPSDYAWHFGDRTDYPAMQHEAEHDLRSPCGMNGCGSAGAGRRDSGA